MPVTVKMPELSRGHIIVPGGWTAKIPEIRALQDASIFVRYYVQHGRTIADAEDTVDESFQALFNRSWLQGLKEMILNRAEEYAQMYPDLVQFIDGVGAAQLHGFDPEKLQAAYVPGENTGRRGKPIVRQMLMEMGRAEIRRRDVSGEGVVVE